VTYGKSTLSPEETGSHEESPHDSGKAAVRKCYILTIPLPIPPYAAQSGEGIWQ